MEPSVCGKLLTHHRKGSKVDEEALRDRFLLRQSTGKGLQMGSRKNRGLRRREGFLFCLFLVYGEYLRIYSVGISSGGAMRGPQAWGRALQACRLLVALLVFSRSFV